MNVVFEEKSMNFIKKLLKEQKSGPKHNKMIRPKWSDTKIIQFGEKHGP